MIQDIKRHHYFSNLDMSDEVDGQDDCSKVKIEIFRCSLHGSREQSTVAVFGGSFPSSLPSTQLSWLNGNLEIRQVSTREQAQKVKLKVLQKLLFNTVLTGIFFIEYRIVVSRSTSYYSGNQKFCFLRSQLLTWRIFFQEQNFFVSQDRKLKFSASY